MPIQTDTGYRVVLSIAQRAFLVMLAERGRSVQMNTPQFKPEVIAGLEDLQKKGLILITKLFGREASEYTMTDLGVQVVDQIYASQKQSAQIENLAKKVEKKI